MAPLLLHSTKCKEDSRITGRLRGIFQSAQHHCWNLWLPSWPGLAMTQSYDLLPRVMCVLPTASGRSQPDSGLGRCQDLSAPVCAEIGNSVTVPGKIRYLRKLGDLSLFTAQGCWRMELSPLIKNTCRSFSPVPLR